MPTCCGSRRMPRNPRFARVNGACLAGGMGLLCMTDNGGGGRSCPVRPAGGQGRLCSDAVMSLLQSIAPRRLINEWALTGEPFDATAALAAGLVNHVRASPNSMPRGLAGRAYSSTSRQPQSRAASMPACHRLDCRSTRRSPIREPDRAAGDDRGRQGRVKALRKRKPPGPDVSGIAVCGRRQAESRSMTMPAMELAMTRGGTSRQGVLREA